MDALGGRLFAGGGLVLTRTEGGDLVALESLPDTTTDMTLRDGRVAWRSSVAGEPICMIDDDFMLWDARTRTATTISSVSGKMSATARFPDAVDIAHAFPMRSTSQSQAAITPISICCHRLVCCSAARS